MMRPIWLGSKIIIIWCRSSKTHSQSPTPFPTPNKSKIMNKNGKSSAQLKTVISQQEKKQGINAVPTTQEPRRRASWCLNRF